MRLHQCCMLVFCLFAIQCCKFSIGQTLQADVGLTRNGSTWIYTVSNLEQATSDNWVTSFYLPIYAQVSNVSAPNNWIVDTDGRHYILWSNQEAYPYPDDISPGSTLTGFSFQSTAPATTASSLVSSWDHGIDDIGPTVNLTILTPLTPVPEPSGVAVLVGLVVTGAMVTLRRKRQ